MPACCLTSTRCYLHAGCDPVRRHSNLELQGRYETGIRQRTPSEAALKPKSADLERTEFIAVTGQLHRKLRHRLRGAQNDPWDRTVATYLFHLPWTSVNGCTISAVSSGYGESQRLRQDSLRRRLDRAEAGCCCRGMPSVAAGSPETAQVGESQSRCWRLTLRRAGCGCVSGRRSCGRITWRPTARV